ncbi:MAG: hypothetical protein OXR84_08145, partial [Magnetovibrio sp.]|nr:hypothetical protein [Magnetovibrio sp.]
RVSQETLMLSLSKHADAGSAEKATEGGHLRHSSRKGRECPRAKALASNDHPPPPRKTETFAYIGGRRL